MSRSHFIFRDVPMDAWVDRYKKSHQRRINRVVQTFGIPMIAVSIPLFLIAPLVRGFWKIPLSLFTAGWGCQRFWHTLEGKAPRIPKNSGVFFVCASCVGSSAVWAPKHIFL